MDLSVELIGKILDHTISAEDALEQQLLELKSKQQILQSSIDLCQKMIDDQAYDEINVVHYLNYVKEEEASGKVFEKIDDFIEDFSSATRFSQIVGGSYLGWWLFPNTWLNRVVKIMWCMLYMLIPVIGIVDDLMDKNGANPVMLIFWIIWILFFSYTFISLRRTEKKYNRKD